MRSVFRVVAILALMLLMAAGSALAVGYDRYEGGYHRATRSQRVTHTSASAWDTVRQASMLEKVPGVIDRAAMAVKDLLSQFGLVEKKIP
ncbi:MAG: hypothetical protein HY914_00055 [Desulfomonile tiedjei]|nr:hypothetical protein [Desulfomonile tiedjei]